MNQDSGYNDPKGQGMPPPYSANPPPPTAPLGSIQTPYPYPPQPTQPPQPMQPPPVQVVYQPVPVMAPMMGTRPTSIICRSCNQRIVTRVETKPSSKTHLFALLLCILFWPCVCLPYCIDDCQNADHYCPNCNAYIGTHSD